MVLNLKGKQDLFVAVNLPWKRAPPTQCCEACGSKPKGKTRFVCRCQSPEIVNASFCMLRLLEFFLRITAKMQHAQSVHVLSLVNMPDDQPSTRKRRDYQSELTCTMSLLTSKGNMSPTEYLELVACSTCQSVVDDMQQNEALLLPELTDNTALQH